MNSKLLVFTNPTCPYCPAAVDLAIEVHKERKDVELKILNTATEEGANLAQQYEIQAVPTILISGPAIKNILGFKGKPLKEQLLGAIDVSLGKIKP